MRINFLLKNKKLIYILITILIIIITATLFILFNNINNSYPNELDNDKKSILAEDAYINYAWGFQYRGTAIFNDGTIYKWNFSDNSLSYSAKTSKEHAKWILKNGSKLSKKVTVEDLEEMKRLIKDLDNNIETQNTAYDAGSNYIAVWNSNNEQIKLKESGDFTGENKSDNSQKLINIINKYFKYIL